MWPFRVRFISLKGPKAYINRKSQLLASQSFTYQERPLIAHSSGVEGTRSSYAMKPMQGQVVL